MSDQELISQFASLMKEQTETMVKFIKAQIMESEQRIGLKIENEISRKIETLFDGYKLTHEKQWEQDRKIEKMETEMEELRARLMALESKIA